MSNKLIRTNIYRIELDVNNMINIGKILTQTIDNMIPDFPKIEFRGQGIKRGTRFWNTGEIGQMLARQVAHYLKDHVILEEKEIIKKDSEE